MYNVKTLVPEAHMSGRCWLSRVVTRLNGRVRAIRTRDMISKTYTQTTQ